MNIGKIPETVLKRSVLNQIKHRREEVLVGPAVGEDCSLINLNEDGIIVMSTDPITATTQDTGTLAVHVTANDIASAGADIIGIMLSILLPEYTSETELRALMRDIDKACEQLHIEILGGHTEVTKAVNRPIVIVTGIGKISKEDKKMPGAACGQEIVMTKWAGLEGTAILAKVKEQELLTRYPASFIDGAKKLLDYISVVPEAIIAKEMGVTSMHSISEGGIFGALWELGAASKAGLEVDLQKIQLKQETIEVCDFFDLNPYMLVSNGSLLITTENANLLVDRLRERGILATVIGRVKEGNDRIIINGDERRFLEPPKTDEIYKVI